MSSNDGLNGRVQGQGLDHCNAHSNGFTPAPEGLLMIVNKEQGSTSEKSPPTKESNFSERPIGRGAFGEVWSVIDPRSGSRLALKRLANIFSSRQFALRAFRELTCLTSIRHENILAAVDILQLPSIHDFQDLYILTEPMDSDLFKIIVSNQPLSTAHIKIFVYQILRGLKYLHSGKIIHRDIKPANLLVNANCSLKICDFGLVRDDDTTSAMTQDVSTQFYRAPEMLMGAKHYTTSIDIWATGCVMAELLSKRILFQANSPIQQLDLIMEVVGTPQMDDMKFACEAARSYILRKPSRSSKVGSQILECLASRKYCTPDAVELMRRLFVFNPEKRATASKALLSKYLRHGRNCYHLTICSCHPTRSRRLLPRDDDDDDAGPCFAADSDDLEPVMSTPMSLLHQDQDEQQSYEEVNAPSLATIRDELYQHCIEKQADKSNQLCINTNSPVFREFNGRAPRGEPTV